MIDDEEHRMNYQAAKRIADERLRQLQQELDEQGPGWIYSENASLHFPDPEWPDVIE